MRRIKGLDTLSMRELSLFSLEKVSKSSCKLSKEGAHKKDGEQFFFAQSDNDRENSFKPKERRISLDVNRKLFPQTVVRHWNRLPKEAM